MVKEQDLLLLKEYLNSYDIEKVECNTLGNYQNAVLVCLDASLSINRKYYTFVVPRIIYFQNKYPDITKLDDLIKLIDTVGIDGFRECWNYNHPDRVRLLYDLCNRLLEISKSYDGDELTALRNWAKDITVNDYIDFKVNGIGVATFQYIRMLLGANTVKPDVHIKNEISKILGKSVRDVYAVELFEQACLELGLMLSDVEHSIWMRKANNSENFDMIWKDNSWVKE